MPFSWTRPGAQGKVGEPPQPGPDRPSETLVCKGLYQVLERLFQKVRPEVLDIGPLCGDTVAYLGGKGARVHVGIFAPPRPAPARESGKPAPRPEPAVLPYDDGAFDLVLAWDQVDFVPPESLPSFGDELHRILRPGGRLYLFSQANRARTAASSAREETFDNPGRFRILDPSHVRHEKPREGSRRRRWIHPNRDLERGLGRLAVDNIHLLRNQLRELTATRP